MSKLKSKINTTNYRKGFINFVIAFIVFFIIAGIGTGIKFGSRIPEIKSQIIAIEKMNHEQENQSEYEEDRNKFEDREHGHEHEIDWESMITLTNSDLIFLGIIAGSFYILLGIYWLFTTAYVISKANQVGMNPYLFGVLTLGTNLFGVAIMWIWIFMHPVCPECGKIQSKKANNCSYCGAAIYIKCPDCGERISIKDEYCQGCGRKMHQSM
ncbi:MAG: zinc ribbon domain-containing protein [Lachnospiraceae bacterium]|nr:zinc ribbon domain-containing protein [Lachnospiraceae bacterium]